MICKAVCAGEEMNLSQVSQVVVGQRDTSRALCPASLCRLLRGIASAAPNTPQQHQRPAPPTPTTISGQSFTIAAILGLKGQRHESYTECSSGGSQQALKSKSRPVNNIGQAPSQTSHHSSKSKRVRTIFTPEQLERLEAEFERQQYMVGPERLYLAHALQLTEAQVKVWFQNRRIKWRKQHLEITQQRLAMARRQQLAEQIDNGSSSCSLPETS